MRSSFLSLLTSSVSPWSLEFSSARWQSLSELESSVEMEGIDGDLGAPGDLSGPRGGRGGGVMTPPRSTLGDIEFAFTSVLGDIGCREVVGVVGWPGACWLAEECVPDATRAADGLAGSRPERFELERKRVTDAPADKELDEAEEGSVGIDADEGSDGAAVVRAICP